MVPGRPGEIILRVLRQESGWRAGASPREKAATHTYAANFQGRCSKTTTKITQMKTTVSCAVVSAPTPRRAAPCLLSNAVRPHELLRYSHRVAVEHDAEERSQRRSVRERQQPALELLD